MGSRGASSGISDNGKLYGTEYKSILKVGNIKFVQQVEPTSSKTPMETMTKGRVYVLINNSGVPSNIVYFDTVNKRSKQIDLKHKHNGKQLHTHVGYVHDEKGTRGLLPKEKRMVDRVMHIWNNRDTY